MVAVTVLVAALLAAADREQILSGEVVAIADGDTLTLLVDKTQHKIRLYGIDAPERGQAYGTKSKERLGELCANKAVTVRVTDKDRYGRLVGVVKVPDGTDVNREMVADGLAWWYRKYAPNDKELEKAEKDAREQRKGLWADKKPMPPWEFRNKKAAVGTAK